MDKEESYTTSFPALEIDQDQAIRDHDDNTNNIDQLGAINYMFHNQQQLISSTSSGQLSFADVMQFADFGPKLGLSQTEKEIGIDPVYFLKFPVLNDQKVAEEEQMVGSARPRQLSSEEIEEQMNFDDGLMQPEFVGDDHVQQQQQHQDFDEKNKNCVMEVKNKRKRTRTVKTSEEVESQRMTHIAVERNRRKQMNEHLRVLRSLMPGSYVQRGDQASIIGGAIEFVRELEQLLQCLESQKRRKLYGEVPNSSLGIQQPHDQPPMYPTLPLQNDQMSMEAAGIQEEKAESKSCLADVEVKVLGFDAMIKILSRRRPGQLIKIIAALEDLQFNILHTNITTIEQTVLYSFNVKIAGECRFSAEDIASSVQQIFNFIHVNSSICDAI